MKAFIRSAGLMAATTVGAGVFSLPYVFAHAGWLASVFYLAVLSAVLMFVHNLYWEVLDKTKERERLVGLTRAYLGPGAARFGFVVIVGGLLLTLVAYLIVGGNFMTLLFPSVERWGIFIFWILSSLPLLLKLKRLVTSEIIGGMVMTGTILLIFLGAPEFSNLAAGAQAIEWNQIFLPFGPILFALAGWTAVEPIFDSSGRRGKPGMAWGTVGAVILYFLFVVGVFGSGGAITEDTISGLAGWPLWKVAAIFIFGLFAIWTSYLPISLEIKNALEKDLMWPHVFGIAFIVFMPPILILVGLSNFLTALGLAGGVFLGLQYYLIVSVAKKALAMSRREKLLANVISATFIIAAVYEVYYFLW